MSDTTPGSDRDRRDPDEPEDPRPEAADEPSGEPTAEAAQELDRLEPAEPPFEPAEPPAETAEATFVGAEPEDAPADRAADEGDAARRAELDAAVERARAEHPPVAESPDPADRTDTAAMQHDDLLAASSEPVRAEEVRRETGVPETIGAAGTGAAASAGGGAPEAPAPPSPQAIYVQAPPEPKLRGNRGFGILVGLIATAVFAVLYAGISYLVVASYSGGLDAAVAVFTGRFLISPVFWMPVVAFFLAFVLLAVVLSRAPWWMWAVFGLLAGVIVYFAYIGGSLLAVAAWTLTPTDAADFLANQWLTPYAIIAAVIARELPIWFGGWIAAHGRTVAERNREAREEYERLLAAGPQPVTTR